jgi:hypothetical protein
VDLFNQIRKKLVILIYFHWHKVLGLLYKRALFDLQFVHNLFWLKLKWNARSKLFYCIIYHSSIWSSRTLTKLKSQSQKLFNERKYQYLKFYTSGNRFVRRTGTFGNLWFFHLSRRTTVIQDLLVRRQFSLVSDKR